MMLLLKILTYIAFTALCYGGFSLSLAAISVRDDLAVFFGVLGVVTSAYIWLRFTAHFVLGGQHEETDGSDSDSDSDDLW